MTRYLQRLGMAVLTAALLVGLAFPAARYPAMGVFIAGALTTTAAAIRPANRGSRP